MIERGYFQGFPNLDGLAMWNKPRMMSNHVSVGIPNPAAGTIPLVGAVPGYGICIDNYRVNMSGKCIAAVAGELDLAFFMGAKTWERIGSVYLLTITPANNDGMLFDTGHVQYTPGYIDAGAGNVNMGIGINFSFAITGFIQCSLGYHYEQY
jgi:hypothetical protein